MEAAGVGVVHVARQTLLGEEQGQGEQGRADERP
jgi:hypothetical protein